MLTENKTEVEIERKLVKKYARDYEEEIVLAIKQAEDDKKSGIYGRDFREVFRDLRRRKNRV